MPDKSNNIKYSKRKLMNTTHTFAPAKPNYKILMKFSEKLPQSPKLSSMVAQKKHKGRLHGAWKKTIKHLKLAKNSIEK